MSDEYRVPALLVEVRKLRAEMDTKALLKALPPSLLFAKAEEASGHSGIARLLYNHAFIEAGYVLDKSSEQGGKPYAVCPCCGYVFP